VEEKMSGIQSQIARVFKLAVYFITSAISHPCLVGRQAGFRINFSVSLLPLSGTEWHKRENVNNARVSYI